MRETRVSEFSPDRWQLHRIEDGQKLAVILYETEVEAREVACGWEAGRSMCECSGRHVDAWPIDNGRGETILFCFACETIIEK